MNPAQGIQHVFIGLCIKYDLVTQEETEQDMLRIWIQLKTRIKELGCWEDKWENPDTDEGPQSLLDMYELLLVASGHINGSETIQELKEKLKEK